VIISSNYKLRLAVNDAGQLVVQAEYYYHEGTGFRREWTDAKLGDLKMLDQEKTFVIREEKR
jgi:hypothetical protein